MGVGAQGVVGTGWLANCEVQNNGGLDGTTQASSPPVDNQQHNWVTSTGLLNGQATHGVQHHHTLWPAVCELGVTVVLVWPPGAPHMVHVKQLHHHHVCHTTLMAGGCGGGWLQRCAPIMAHTAPKAWSNGWHKGADTLQPNTVWSSKATQPHCSHTQQCGTGVWCQHLSSAPRPQQNTPTMQQKHKG